MYRRGVRNITGDGAHDIDRLKQALETEKGRRMIDFVCPYTNRTPLIAASEDACIDCAEEPKHGADVNKQSNRLRTP